MHTPPLTREQVRDIDRRTIAEYGMLGLVLMENAGRGCVDLLESLGIQGPVAICCGKGNNGGDGFVIARHLDARGHAVRVLLCCDPRQLTGDAAANYQILARTDVPISFLPTIGSSDLPHLPTNSVAEFLLGADWIVDALLGTGAHGEPRPPLDQVIAQMNASPAKKLAIDLPSGLDCDTGQAAAATFRADHTCTFVAEKIGFRQPTARPWLGTVHVLDIGVPRQLLAYLWSQPSTNTEPTGPRP